MYVYLFFNRSKQINKVFYHESKNVCIGITILLSNDYFSGTFFNVSRPRNKSL